MVVLSCELLKISHAVHRQLKPFDEPLLWQCEINCSMEQIQKMIKVLLVTYLVLMNIVS